MSRNKKRAPSEKISRFIRVKIEDLNESGDGVAFYQKKKLTIKKTLPGEEVLVTYNPDRPRKARIELKRILVTAPDRVTPPCPYFEDCGGCHLQHLNYSRQLTFKQQVIQRQLLAYPELKSIHVAPVVGMPEPKHYRNKTQMPFQRMGEAIHYGLYRRGTHELIPMDFCLVESKDANRALQIVRDWARQYQIEPYDEIEHSGILRHVMVRKGQFTNQVMVVLVTTTREVPHWKFLVEALKQGLSTLRSVILNINNRRTNVILGEENLVMWGDPFIEEQLGRIRYRIYPETFFQTNSVQTVKLLETLVREAKPGKTDQVLELYSGTGTIGLYLASRVKQVVGMDINQKAIQAANQNASDNQIANATYYPADASEDFLNQLPDGFHPSIIIVDPPRKGLSQRTIDEMVRLSPQKIVYISCNPRTLIRDLADFYRYGYRAQTIFPFDMFPQTAHVESLVILEKQPEQ